MARHVVPELHSGVDPKQHSRFGHTSRWVLKWRCCECKHIDVESVVLGSQSRQRWNGRWLLDSRNTNVDKWCLEHKQVSVEMVDLAAGVSMLTRE